MIRILPRYAPPREQSEDPAPRDPDWIADRERRIARLAEQVIREMRPTEGPAINPDTGQMELFRETAA
jgi:hypothetical protein